MTKAPINEALKEAVLTLRESAAGAPLSMIKTPDGDVVVIARQVERNQNHTDCLLDWYHEHQKVVEGKHGGHDGGQDDGHS